RRRGARPRARLPAGRVHPSAHDSWRRNVPKIDTGDTAWVLISAALVLFMTPGLALFYGGMVRAKNVLAMLMQNFFAMGVVTILWVLFGYSLAFGGAGNGGFIGNLDFVGLDGMTNALGNFAPGVPDLA